MNLANVPDSLLGRYEVAYVSAVVTISVLIGIAGLTMLMHGALKCSKEVKRGYTTDIRRARAHPDLNYFNHLSMVMESGPGAPRPERVRLFGKATVISTTGAVY